MRGRIGTQTRIGSILPGASRLAKIVGISRSAKRRLLWIDHYRKHRCAQLTCRHYAISRSLFYKWYRRFSKIGVRGLEDQSTRPRKVRTPTTSLVAVDLVRKLRKQNPEYSKYKLTVILQRDHQVILSASTVGRIIKRYDLFFAPTVKPKGHPHRLVHRLRLPKELRVNHPGQLIEVDVKHLPNLESKRYAFVAIDRITRQTTIHVATTVSSRQAAIAWTKACRVFHVLPQAVLSDNGSENLGKFAEGLEQQAIPQYRARPRTPKDKPYVERVIGSLERECIQRGGLAQNLEDQQRIIDEWLIKYHDYRPHQALNYLTPNEYYATLKEANKLTKVSTM